MRDDADHGEVVSFMIKKRNVFKRLFKKNPIGLSQLSECERKRKDKD